MSNDKTQKQQVEEAAADREAGRQRRLMTRLAASGFFAGLGMSAPAFDPNQPLGQKVKIPLGEKRGYGTMRCVGCGKKISWNKAACWTCVQDMEAKANATSLSRP